MTGRVTVEYRLTRNDFLRIHRTRFWRSLWWLLLVTPLVALAPVLRGSRFGGELRNADTHALLWAVMIGAGIALFFAFCIEVCARSFSSHAVRKHPSALAIQRLSFSDGGVAIETARTPLLLAWNCFVRAHEGRREFELYAQNDRLLAIPFTALAGEFQKTQIRDLLHAHLGGRARLKA